MKIALLTGHSILSNGSSSGANGYIDEYSYILELLPVIKEKLIYMGYKCDMIAPPEKIFKEPHEELKYKLPRANLKDKNGKYFYDLVVELHLNASLDKDMKSGVNVYYKTGDNYGYVVSKRICSSLHKLGFINGGVHTPPLYIITETIPTCIVVELFYCTSKKDIHNINRKGMDELALALVQGIDSTSHRYNANIPKTEDINNSEVLHGWYYNDNGTISYYKQNYKYFNTIKNINGKYYIFDKEGNLSYGWKQINGNIYYFDKNYNGALTVNTTLNINGDSYKFNEDGILLTKVDNVVQYQETDKIMSNSKLIIYQDNITVTDIMQLYRKYPTASFIRESDYPKYGIRYKDEIHVEV